MQNLPKAFNTKQKEGGNGEFSNCQTGGINRKMLFSELANDRRVQ